jgi:hypothetical protein
LFNDADIMGDSYKGLWVECASTAAYEENVIVRKNKKTSPLELIFKEKTKGLKRLKSSVKYGDQRARKV